MRSKWKVSSILLLAVFATIASTQETNEADKWASIHLKEEREWATRTHADIGTVRRIIGAAGLKSTDDFQIENLDLNSLRSRKQVLLSTWESGTGRCLTVHVLQANDKNRYQEIFAADQASDDQNFCSISALGAAHAHACGGAVIVEMPIGSAGGQGSPFNEPTKLEVLCSKFNWSGKEYALSGTTHVSVPARKYEAGLPACLSDRNSEKK